MRILLLFFLICLNTPILAQIGINTTNPQAQLDISANNSATPNNTDGLLIPRIDAFPAVNPTASQQSMLVYLTTSSAGKQPGFYYWDNPTTSWMNVTSPSNLAWYKVGGTAIPNNNDDMFHYGKVVIGTNTGTATLTLQGVGQSNVSNPSSLNADAYGLSNVVNGAGTGMTTGEYTQINGNGSGLSVGNYIRINNTNNISEHDGIWIDMQNANTTNNNRNGIRVDMSGTTTSYNWRVGLSNAISANTSGNKAGVVNSMSGNGNNYGIMNTFQNGYQSIGINNSFLNLNGGIGAFNLFSSNSTGTNYGSYSQFNGSSTGTNYSVYNEMTYGKGPEYAVYNDLRNFAPGVTSDKYGTYTIMDGSGTGNKYGSYTSINNSAGGTHYGVYSDVTKSGSYAGYFLGKVAIGTTTANNYFFPSSRGTNNQIMQTDGSGNVSWVTNSVKPYITTGAALGTYDVPLGEHTIRIFNGVTTVRLPSAIGNTGKTFIIIGSNGISAKTLTSLGGVVYDDVTNTTINVINPNERYAIQSDGTDWIVIGR